VTDTLGTDDPAVEEPAESRDIKLLRDKAKRTDELEARIMQMEREQAFANSGIDLDSGPGKLLLKAYDGKAEPDAIREAATAFGVPLKGETPPEEPPPPIEDTGTQERRVLAEGAPADTNQQETPYTTAEKAAMSIRERGGTREDEAAAWLGTIVPLANAGDPRVTLDPRTGQRRGGIQR
jgi:hypothetical protein